MNTDFKELFKSLTDIGKGLRELAEIISETWDGLMCPIRKLFKILSEMDFKEKKKYAPVKKITPNKVVLLSKRSNVHYCRNNC